MAKIKDGHNLRLARSRHGGYRPIVRSLEFERQMAMAEKIMDADREVLRQLAH